MNNKDIFAIRNESGISKAEDAAEKYFSKYDGLLYLRYGFNEIKSDIPVDQWMTIPQFIRCSPDYVTVYNNKFNFIEVKGCLDKVKIKLTDFMEYGKWAGLTKLKIFIHSSSSGSIYILKYEELLDYISQEVNEFGRYKDNSRLYFEIPLENLSRFKKCL